VDNLIFYALIGLGLGGLYAMSGMSLILSYQGAGVVNFAQGAMAMFVVFDFTQLRTAGQIYLPWINFLPDRHTPVLITVTHGPMAFVPAILVCVAMAVFLGLLVHLLVFRPLRYASSLGKVVASVGLLLYLQAVALTNFGQIARQLPTVLPAGAWTNFLGLGHPFPKENLWAGVCAVLMAGGLWALYRFTTLGISTRAAAENEKGSVLLGYSPDRLAAASWVISSLVGAAAGFLVGPIAGSLSPSAYDVFIVPTLGAALVGLLRSFPGALLGGLGLGVIESLCTYLASKPWFPAWLSGSDALASAIPLLVIAIVLFVRGDSLPTRGIVGERRLPPASRPVRVSLWVVVGAVVAIGYGALFNGPWVLALTTTLITSILMLSYVVITGYVGQISLAQLGLAGVAGFFMVKLMSGNGNGEFAVHGFGLPMILAVPIAMALAVVVGVVVGLPAVRIRGVQLAIITLAAGVTMVDLYFDSPGLTGVPLGAGAPVPKPEVFGLNLGVAGKSGLSDRLAFTIFVTVLLVVVAVIVSNLRNAATGRRFLAVRANERAAAAVGINVARNKLLAFGVAAAIAGLAGCLFSFQAQNISSANWDPLVGLTFLAFAYLGGISSVNGAIVGGFIATSGVWAYFLQVHFSNLTNYWTLFGGLGLILTAILNPLGIAPGVQLLLRPFFLALRHWRGPEWMRAARRLGPPVVIGAVLGYVFWDRRPTANAWPVVDGVVLALMIRAIALQAWWATPSHRRQLQADALGRDIPEPAAEGPLLGRTDTPMVQGGKP
jgi:branched-chain amino acid transport system permease protein